MRALSFNAISCCGFAITVCLLGSAYFLEYVLEVEPCSLCMLQRFCFYASGLIFLLATIRRFSNKYWQYFLCFSNFLFICCGLLLAGRQVWLQHQPLDNVPECAPGLERLLQTNPLFTSLKTVILRSGECAKIDATFLGLPLVYWSILGFMALLAFVGLAMKASRRNS